ncbi:MAG: peptidyl-prolyl cis-trans isomerase [Bacteroidales bacterium]
MRLTFLFIFSGLILFSSISCQRGSKEENDHLVVEVDGHKLTHGALKDVMGKYQTIADSTRMADAYIRNWIDEILLYEKAKNNIDHLQEIEEEAEAYKRRMVIFEYQQRLVNERLSVELTDQELEQFYEQHKREFVLKQPIIKGLFLKVPADAPQLNELKKWMRKTNDESLEKIDKYSLQNALVYEYFLDRWVPFDQLMNNIPFEITNGNRFLRENKSLEVTQDSSWYYLSVDRYIPEGEIQPFEFARDKVREALLNQKKKGFVRSIEDELYQKAIREQKIKFYGKESNGSE